MLDESVIRNACDESVITGRPIRLVSGCFDLLHIGHVDFLTEAKGSDGILVVAVLRDAFIRERKGSGRPIVKEKQRLALIQSLKVTDYSLLLEREDTENLIKKLKPAEYVIGGDRRESALPEQTILDTYHVTIRFTKLHGDESTTSLIEEIIRQNVLR